MRLPLLLAASLLPLACAAGSVDEGRKLVAEHGCESCHARKDLGEAKSIYLRKDRRVTSLAKLEAQVAVCNSELKLQMFPEDEAHVVAFLDHAYYHFTSPATRAP